ncbi:MAG: protoheme IX farnesyltransferase, partial [Planctomycetota bacterium]
MNTPLAANSDTLPAVREHGASGRDAPRGIVESVLELSKARLSSLVLLSCGAGFWLAAGDDIPWARLVWTLLGTLIAAFGANALNQCIERHRDARMRRTQRRPLPAGALSTRFAWLYGLFCGLCGPVLLWWGANGLTAALGLATVGAYVLVYTPLKTRSTTNTLVGALVGAIPPLMGWAAASGALAPGAWLLAAILFLWQVPHFLALAWLYRDDYRRGGFRMLASEDDNRATRTRQAVVLYAAALVPISLMLATTGAVGALYAFGAAALGVAFVLMCLRLYWELSRRNARRVFLAS